MKPAQTGDFGEAMFAAEAIKRGYVIAKPFGQVENYDFILDNGAQLFKVQVKAANKSTSTKTNSPYRFGAHYSNRPDEVFDKFDVMACFSITTNTWHLIPAKDITVKGIYLSEGKSKYDIYKNNWNVFDAAVNESVDTVKLVDDGDDSTPF